MYPCMLSTEGVVQSYHVVSSLSIINCMIAEQRLYKDLDKDFEIDWYEVYFVNPQRSLRFPVCLLLPLSCPFLTEINLTTRKSKHSYFKVSSNYTLSGDCNETSI